MGCGLGFIFCHRPCPLSSVFLFLLMISSTQMRFKAEAGRANLKSSGFSLRVDDEKTLLRAQIGSRPPNCERKCNSCGHCEAIQVPTNPAQNGKRNFSTVAYNVAYARGDDSSNYKPLSWKCKCGKYIFDP